MEIKLQGAIRVLTKPKSAAKMWQLSDQYPCILLIETVILNTTNHRGKPGATYTRIVNAHDTTKFVGVSTNILANQLDAYKDHIDQDYKPTILI